MENKHYSKVPVFENGLAQPVFPFTDGKTGEKYDPATSDIVRYCVYVESDYDMDGDGKRDLVKVFVQVPRSAVEGNYKAATLFEARPYCAGVQEDGYDHMKEVAEKEYRKFDLADLDHKAAPRVPSGSASAMDLALKADPSDWYYKDKGSTNSMVYENIDSFNYYLVRGFAVIVSAGFGALGSDGFNYVGSEYERDAFKSVVEWIHDDRVAYADREGTITTKADWANGNVAMTGRSYAGTMPFAVATTGVEGLKTIVPVAGIADWYSQQNMQGAQRYWPKEMLNSFLAYYCSSRYNDSTLSEKQLDDIAAFHHELSLQQLKCGFDYDEKFWGSGNYRLNADKIKCPALIVQGLNDENVSTKQFEMMLKSFQKAGQTVKAILHQGPHITPTMPNKGYGILIDGKFYDDIVNEWISHYLYGVKNQAEDMPAVLVQTNHDQRKWETSASWDTGHSMKLTSGSTGTAVIDTDWEAAGISGRAGSRISSVVELRDIMPTLLDIAGARDDEHYDGKSLTDVIAGRKDTVRDYLHGEHSYGPFSNQWIVTEKDKYIWMSESGEEQYFDLAADPHELENLISDSSRQERIAFLRSLLIRELEGRSEGFVTNGRLVAGRPYPAVIR